MKNEEETNDLGPEERQRRPGGSGTAIGRGCVDGAAIAVGAGIGIGNIFATRSRLWLVSLRRRPDPYDDVPGLRADRGARPDRFRPHVHPLVDRS